MKRRVTPALLFIAGFIILLGLLGAFDDNTELTIDKVDIVADVMPDGDLYVEELFTYTVRGEFTGFNRYMDDYGDSNVEFFEAYVPPDDRELGQFGYEGLERYPAGLRSKRGSYRVEAETKDQTVQMYYRYRLDREALKYEDGGELDWVALDNNEVDHRNVSVTVRLRQAAAEPVIGYAYDRSGGAMVEETNQVVRYENELLLENDSVRLKLFFPAEVLPELEASPSSVTLTERLADETALQQRFAKREELLEIGRQASRWLTYAAAAGILFYVLSVRKLIAWGRGRRISLQELEDMDPIRLASLFKKGNPHRIEALAGVFALRRRGMIDMDMVQAGPRFQEDRRAPKQLPQFVARGSRAGLNRAERQLLSWLFRGTGVMNLENVAGPTKTERRRKSAVAPYMKRLRGLERGFVRWRRLMENVDDRFVRYVDYRPRKIIVPVLALVHLAVIVYLHVADATVWGWVASIAAVMGIGVGWVALRRNRKRHITIFLIACLFVAAQIVHEPAVNEYLSFVFLSLMLVAVLPRRVTDSASAAYRSAILRYRRRLAKGGGDAGNDPGRLERRMEAALLLGVGRRFAVRARKKLPASSFYSASPLLDPAAADAIEYAFVRSWEGVKDPSNSGSGGYADGGDGGGSYGDSGDGGSDGGSGGDGGGGDGGGGGGGGD
ncbi:DUF2207 domain-containing protein [Paenibacillus soyae]|uniref:DUF2207 domain-containing protein n=1 Tax=Paenibacillus soyae TaxID=2969249 RepID=A0A9X2MSP0_9BACL|nr:DUF2207 domain-containing protein [Paenibacillus soyae]MCR2807418.1 DUF2207 domain-containing protein [Paenibacillus soyae]